MDVRWYDNDMDTWRLQIQTLLRWNPVGSFGNKLIIVIPIRIRGTFPLPLVSCCPYGPYLLKKANRLGFLPIVFESNCFLHRKSVDFLHKVAENCAVDKGIHTEAIFNYFLKGLSFSLQYKHTRIFIIQTLKHFQYNRKLFFNATLLLWSILILDDNHLQ